MWGDPGVSKKLRLSNGTVPFGTGGMPIISNLQQTGILRELRMLTTGSLTVTAGTGTAAVDVLGPWNLYTLISVSPNQQTPILSLSGYGLYLANLMKSAESDRMAPDVTAISVRNAEASTDIYNVPNTTNAGFRFPLLVPISQRIKSIGGDIGQWPLQNPAITLGVNVTPNSASASTPYNIFSLTAGQAPYLATGNATVTLGSPTFELIRELWQVPASAADYPPFQLVSSMIEESPQGANVASATKAVWQMTALSGILARLALFVYDSNASSGVAASNLTASNALVLSYDADTVKFSESSYAALARQRDMYGFDLPQGVYVWDLLGQDLTMQDTLNSNTVGNIKATANFGAALGSTSFMKIVKQVISPLEVK